MADAYITGLPAASSSVGSELLEIAQLSASVTISAATISALASDNSYNDSGSGFVTAGFGLGDRVRVQGFTGDTANNILAGIITALTAGKMTIGGADGDVIVDDAAGETVTISKWVSRRGTIGPGLKLVGSILVPTVIGVMAKKAADETGANYSSTAAVPWTAEEYKSVAAMHDNSTNNTRLVLPDLTPTYGLRAAKISLRAFIQLGSIGANEPISLTINKNGSNGVGLPFIQHGSAGTAIGIEALAIDVPVLGDGTEYFEATLDAGADPSVTISSGRSCFQYKVTDWQA